jgi:hypothetical protein
MKKTIITTAVITACILVTAFHAYTVYQLRKQTIANTQAIQQFVNFINQAQQPVK